MKAKDGSCRCCHFRVHEVNPGCYCTALGHRERIEEPDTGVCRMYRKRFDPHGMKWQHANEEAA